MLPRDIHTSVICNSGCSSQDTDATINCQSEDNCVKKIWYIYQIMEYHSDLKKKKNSSNSIHVPGGNCVK